MTRDAVDPKLSKHGFKSPAMSDRLPTERVFLIRLSSSAEPSNGNVAGRIEHVPTGRVAKVSSAADIEQFMSEMLELVAG